MIAQQNGSSQNAENLLDIDFDGAAPLSSDTLPAPGTSGLEGLAGTPQRVASPSSGAPSGAGNMADMMGLFDTGNTQSAPSGGNFGQSDFTNGFAGLDLGGNNQPPDPHTHLQAGSGQKKTNEDLLGMF